MFAFLIRQAVGIATVTSPIWGAALLAMWIKRDRKNHANRKTTGSAITLNHTVNTGI